MSGQLAAEAANANSTARIHHRLWNLYNKHVSPPSTDEASTGRMRHVWEVGEAVVLLSMHCDYHGEMDAQSVPQFVLHERQSAEGSLIFNAS